MVELTRNQSYLAYLHFAHTVCTGGRFFNEAVSEAGVPPDNDIIGACIAEAFTLFKKKAQIIDTTCYRFPILR